MAVTKKYYGVITSEMVIPIVVSAFHSSAEKAGIMMCFTNVILFLLTSLLTVKWVASELEPADN